MRSLHRLSAIFLCFCALSAQAKPPIRVASKELHVSLEVPADWKRVANSTATAWFYTGPVEKAFSPNVSVIVSPVDSPKLPDAKVFFDGIRKQYSTMGTVYGMKKTTVGGVPAYLCHAHLHGAGIPEIENIQLFYAYKSHIYIFTFTELAALKKKYDPIGEQIAASIRFEK